MNPLPWRQAWQQALYAPTGFYREELPHDHFQTACRVAPDLLGLAQKSTGSEPTDLFILEGNGDGTFEPMRAINAQIPVAGKEA